MKPGDLLGPYRVLEKLGEGGMGEVYRARDTRLDRSVAIKVLPAAISEDADRRARFEREAKTIAGLSHPHICTLYDVGEHDGATYLVMEHLTGETLAARLEKGPLPLEQALTVATEIADALATAHRQGVIHRDLKPGNVMLTKTGAKLLDFGLAKLTGHGEQAAAAGLASAPTRTKPLTTEGTIVGTLQYMAPEQVEGKPADARTDLWALGAILYEMLTGKRAFDGTSAASLIANIMNAEPPAVATLQPVTPPALDRLVRQCLAKVPDDRPDTAHDVANELRWMRETSGAGTVAGALAGVPPRRRRGPWTALVVAEVLVAGMAGAGLMWVLRPSWSVVGFALLVNPAEELNAGGTSPSLPSTPGGSRTALAWTPDGQALVFVGRRGGVQQLYWRRLDAEARPLAGTEGAQLPAVSHDSQWVAFWAAGMIKKVSLGGGPPQDLASHPVIPPLGMAWDDRGRLFFGGTDGRIWMIPTAEEKREAVTTLGTAEVAHTLPTLLPGGRVLLYTVRRRLWSWGDEEVVAQPLPTGDRVVLLKDATDARYVRTGHLVFLRRGVLYAVPFDAERLQRTGPERPVLDGVAQALTADTSDDITGAGQFAVGSTGTLAWIPSPIVASGQWRIVTVDRHGQVTPLSAFAQSFGGPLRLSPDRRRLAVTTLSLTGRDLCVFELTRPAPLDRRTTAGEASWAVWGQGGQELVFFWRKNGREMLSTQRVDGTAEPQELLPGRLYPSSVAPDGRIAVADAGDIFVVTLKDGKASVTSLIQTPSTEQSPAFSPDGHWLVYGSDTTGKPEVYVRAYPDPGPPQSVSVEGGQNPAWNPNGRELFFLSLTDPSGRRRMMAVEFTPGSPPRTGLPRELFTFDNSELRMSGTWSPSYDVADGGQRFYALQRVPSAPTPPVTHVNLIRNWAEQLKQRVPVQR